MNRPGIYLVAAVFGVIVACSPTLVGAAPGASFRGWDNPTGGEFWVEAVSADGLTAVGKSYFFVTEADEGAYRWNAATGLQRLADLSWEFDRSCARDVTADGSVIAGTGYSRGLGTKAVRWSGGLPYDISNNKQFVGATAISADGSAIVVTTGSKVYRLLQGGTMQQIGGDYYCLSTDISADGSVVVGAYLPTPGQQAFRWTETAGIQVLGFLPGGAASSASAVSGNGLVVVGMSDSTEGGQAFRWTQEGGMQGLGDLPGGAFSSNALAASFDGSIVVGYSETIDANFTLLGESVDPSDPAFRTVEEAFIWDKEHGMRSLMTVLTEDCGLDLSGWWLSEVRDISADGMTIVGVALNPAGEYASWIVTLPEPGTLVLLAAGGLALLRRRPLA